MPTKTKTKPKTKSKAKPKTVTKRKVKKAKPSQQPVKVQSIAEEFKDLLPVEVVPTASASSNISEHENLYKSVFFYPGVNEVSKELLALKKQLMEEGVPLGAITPYDHPKRGKGLLIEIMHVIDPEASGHTRSWVTQGRYRRFKQRTRMRMTLAVRDLLNPKGPKPQKLPGHQRSHALGLAPEKTTLNKPRAQAKKNAPAKKAVKKSTTTKKKATAKKAPAKKKTTASAAPPKKTGGGKKFTPADAARMAELRAMRGKKKAAGKVADVPRGK